MMDNNMLDNLEVTVEDPSKTSHFLVDLGSGEI
jgi:hypothetical protein